MSKTKKEIRDVAVAVGLLGIGFDWMWGIGAGISAAIIFFLLLMIGKIWVAHDKHVAGVQKRIYDNLLDQGTQMDFNGVLWTKDCRIDPDTGAVIKPGA